jgi:hypothetical protein
MDPRLRPNGEVPTKNFFAPLRTGEMDVELTLVEGISDEPSSELQQPSSNKAGKPPPHSADNCNKPDIVTKKHQGYCHGQF